MNRKERAFRQRVETAIKDCKDLSTPLLKKQLEIIKGNLNALKGPQTKIVSLKEHVKVKSAFNVLLEVLRDRKGEVIPEEPIDPNKPKSPRKARSGHLKLR